jgi:hypothetical protein
MFGLPSKEDLDNVVQQAPANLLTGLVHALTFVPDQMKGAFLFGEGVWNNMTPEQQATAEQAVAKLIVTVTEAYVKKGS